MTNGVLPVHLQHSMLLMSSCTLVPARCVVGLTRHSESDRLLLFWIFLLQPLSAPGGTRRYLAVAYLTICSILAQQLLPLLTRVLCVLLHQILFSVTGEMLPGEVLALMGPSGSGKTSLLSIISGRAPKAVQNTGKVTTNGNKFTKAEKRRVGFVLQDDLLYEVRQQPGG